MKRTKKINHDSFRKYWRCCYIAPVTLTVSAVFALAGCEKSDKNVSLYMNSSNDCTKASIFLNEQCATTHIHDSAQQKTVKTAPKYTSHADCVATLNEGQCTQVLAQAGLPAESKNNGDMWMPLMAGYMMGRMMGGGGYAQQQPLFSSNATNSPVSGQFIDAGGKSMTIPKTTLAPKSETTRTITRGGFGETVAKQNTMRNNNSTTYLTMGS